MRSRVAFDYFVVIIYASLLFLVIYPSAVEGLLVSPSLFHRINNLRSSLRTSGTSKISEGLYGVKMETNLDVSAAKVEDDHGTLPTFRRHEPMVIGDDTTMLLDHFLVPKHYEGALDSLMIPYGTIISRIDKLAHDIIKDYDGRTIHMLCVLKGAEKFFHDLCASIRAYHAFQDHGPIIPFVFDFVRVSSYSGTESTGEVLISGMDVTALQGQHVLIVEDIIDTGLTMTKLIAKLERDIHPASVRVAALLEKRTHLSNGFKGDYVAFSVPDKFIVGYGLDYNEVFRDLGHIAVISQAGIEKYRQVKRK